MIIKCSSSIRVFSEVATAEDIANLLNCTPSKSHNKGDLISTSSPSKAVRKESIWLYESEINGDNCIEDCFAKLTPVIEIIKGCRHNEIIKNADVLTGLFSDNEQLNFYIPQSFSTLLGAAGLDHLISGYITTVAET